MQINSTPNYQPNFKQVNLVQVSKKAFLNPQNSTEVANSFCAALDKASGVIFRGKLANILAMLGLNSSRVHKTMTFLEYPSFPASEDCMGELKKLNYSPSWFMQNTGLPLIPPCNKDYHSFYVLTKEHFDRIKSFFSFSYLKNNIITYSKEAIERYPQDISMRKLYAQKKFFAAHDEIFSDILKNNQVHSFKIENLNEIENIIRELDL